jgi:hypothetical protein
MKVLMILFIIFSLTSLLIISNNSLSLSHSEERGEFMTIYFSWINKIYSNTISITGNVVKMDWSPSS